MTDSAVLLAAYDSQLRGSAEAGADVAFDRDGPLIRVEHMRRGFVSYRSLDGFAGAELDALIARQVAHFAALNKPVEWKSRSHDRPADLPDRLRAAGFVAEPTETVMVGDAAAIAAEPVLPTGVTLRAVCSEADFAQIVAMKSQVWGEDMGWLADELRSRAADTDVLVAEAGAQVVSAAWITYQPGTDFAGLWGGSTLRAWRGRGIYRALVARRAQLAVARGVRYLQVDASDDSRPILRRLGFIAITTTTPYVWSPEA